MKKIYLPVLLCLACLLSSAQDWNAFYSDYQSFYTALQNDDMVSRIKILRRLEIFKGQLQTGTSDYYEAEFVISEAYIACGRTEIGIPRAINSLKFFKTIGDNEHCAALCNIIATGYEGENADSVLYYSKENLNYLLPLVKKAPKSTDQITRFVTYNCNIIDIYLRLDELDLAEKQAIKTRKAINKISFDELPNLSYHKMGWVMTALRLYDRQAQRYTNSHNYKLAEEYFVKRSQLAQAEPNVNVPKADIDKCFIGLVNHYAQNNDITHIEYLSELFYKTVDKYLEEGKSQFYSYYASLSISNSLPDSAQALLKLKKDIITINKDNYQCQHDGMQWSWADEVANICLNMGDIYWEANDPTIALNHYQEGRSIIENAKDVCPVNDSLVWTLSSRAIDCYLALALRCIEEQSFDDAIMQFQNAIHIVEKMRGAGLMQQVMVNDIYPTIVRLESKLHPNNVKSLVNTCFEYVCEDIDFYNELEHESDVQKKKAYVLLQASNIFEDAGDFDNAVYYMQQYVNYYAMNGIYDDWYDEACGFLSAIYQRLFKDYLSATRIEFKILEDYIQRYGTDSEMAIEQFIKLFQTQDQPYLDIYLDHHVDNMVLRDQGMALDCVREWRDICEKISETFGDNYLSYLQEALPNELTISEAHKQEDSYFSLIEHSYIDEVHIYLYFGDVNNATLCMHKTLDFFENKKSRNKYKAVRELSELFKEYHLNSIVGGLLLHGLELATKEKESLEWETFLTKLSRWHYQNGDYDAAWSAAQYFYGDAPAIIDITNYAEGCNTIANIANYWGNYEDAIVYGKRALAVMEHKRPDVKESFWIDSAMQRQRDTTSDFFKASTLRANLAGYYIMAGDSHSAKVILDEDYEANKAKGIQPSLSSLKSLAILNHQNGDLSAAINIMTDIYNEKNQRHFDTVEESGFLSSYYTELGDRDSTAHYTRLYSDAQISLFVASTAGMSEIERYNFWDFREGSYMLDLVGYNCSTFDDGLSDLYYDLALRYKGFLLNYSNIIRHNILQSGDKDLIEAYNKYRDLKKQGDKESEYYERQCMHLYSRHPEYYSQYTLPSWKDVKSKLREDEIAIEFVRCLGVEKKDNTYKALVLSSSSEVPTLITLCKEKELDNLTELFQKKATDGMLASLFELVWEPLVPYLKGISSIYFSPHGVICQLGIENALDGNGSIIGEIYNIKRVSSTASIINDETTSFSTIVLYGGLQYDASSTLEIENNGLPSSSLSRTGYRYLSGTLEEVKTIDSMIRKSGLSSRMYTGVDGTEASFKSLSGSNTAVIHIATHGFYYSSSSEMKRKNKDLYTKASDNNNEASDIPIMKQSGLVFAGASSGKWTGTSSQKDDNVLFSDEICGLDLTGTKLLVLSACQTGLGQVGGDGLYGLQRSFKLAGVETTIMSLWEVDDNATKLFMTSLYSKLLKGHTKSESFNYAIKRVRKKYDDPRYWAAFIMLD